MILPGTDMPGGMNINFRFAMIFASRVQAGIVKIKQGNGQNVKKSLHAANVKQNGYDPAAKQVFIRTQNDEICRSGGSLGGICSPQVIGTNLLQFCFQFILKFGDDVAILRIMSQVVILLRISLHVK